MRIQIYRTILTYEIIGQTKINQLAKLLPIFDFVKIQDMQVLENEVLCSIHMIYNKQDPQQQKHISQY